MAHDAGAAASGPQKLVIRNIGLLLSGDIDRPIFAWVIALFVLGLLLLVFVRAEGEQT